MPASQVSLSMLALKKKKYSKYSIPTLLLIKIDKEGGKADKKSLN